MATSNAICGSSLPSRNAGSPDPKTDDIRCRLCQQTHCDVSIVGCGCLIHTTCIPLTLLSKQPNGPNSLSCVAGCPSCGQSPVVQINVLPLPIHALEQASRMRGQSNYIHKDSPTGGGAPAGSIALVNTSSKRGMTSRPFDKSFRTGRWASEESTYVDKLIQCFDAGLLALPHGIKLNDFLCEMLSCRTSRLTKKLKNAKLSTRSYRSLISGGLLIDANRIDPSFGAAIQRAQTLFLKTVTPDWVRMELQFNISRMWRTHLANFCLQIGFASLDTKQWFTSLDTVEFMSMSSGEAALQERRKRMKIALSDDVNFASMSKSRNTVSAQNGSDPCSKNGVFMGGLPVKKLSELNLKKMADDRNYQVGSRFDSDGKNNNCQPNFVDFGQVEGLKHSTSLASFAELFTPEFGPRASRASSRAGSFSLENPSQINTAPDAQLQGQQICAQRSDSLLDNAIDSILESSGSEHEQQGMFLQNVATFLSNMKSPFQHADLWVPMDMAQTDTIHVGSNQKITATNTSKMNNVVYGDGQSLALRLTHAGYISVPNSAPSHTLQRLNEFGMYSKHFSFSPGFGAPGRVYLSGQPSWETNVCQATPEQFARVGGARTYGVNTCLAIPVSTHIGNMVVILYSTSSLAVDAAFEKICMDFFKRLRPEPRWKLTIDVGIQEVSEVSRERKALLVANTYKSKCSSPKFSTTTPASIVPPSPTLQSLNSISSASATTNASHHTWNEQSLALLLGKYMPLNPSQGPPPDLPNNHITGNPEVAEHLMSLRLFLLRHSSCRSDSETNMASIIMERYRVLSGSMQKEPDLVLQLVNEWKNLVSTSSAPLARTANLKTSHSNNSPPIQYSAQPFLDVANHPYQAGAQLSFHLPGNLMEPIANLPANFPHDLSFLRESSAKCFQDAGDGSLAKADRDASQFSRVVSEQGPMGEGQFGGENQSKEHL